MKSLDILSIKVITGGGGPDYIFFTLNITESTWPYKANAVAKMEAAAGFGETRARALFYDVPIEVVDLKR